MTCRPVFVIATLILILFAGNCATAADPQPDGGPKPVKDKDEKPTGPEHNVTLAEEPGVVDLLARAQKARAKAEKDPEVWPECVKYYADILKKYPNTVYLDRWEGPDKKDRGYENGLYKSTRERVAADIASLPPAGLSSYRVINDPLARALYTDAQEQFDERKMEQAAQTYFSSSFGDDALAWLSEVAYDRGSQRQAIARIARIAKHPSPDVPKLGLLTRTLMAQAALNDRAGANKTLEEIQSAMQDPKNGTLRAGHAEGPAAIEKLKARIAAIPEGDTPTITNVSDPARSMTSTWETYFGNASHNPVLQSRQNIGLLKWSMPIAQLLRGPNEEPTPGTILTAEGTQVEDPTIKQHLTVKDGFFYLCDDKTIAAYPVGNPRPGPASVGGNALFFWPTDVEFKSAEKPVNNRQRVNRVRVGVMNGAVCQHPYFVTLSGDRAYGVIGSEPAAQNINNVWGGVELKQGSNYLVALQRRSGKRVWALESQRESPEFKSHSKADQEWLKTAYFVSAPTYESGTLYAMAIQGGAMHEAWVAAFDANTGQMQWRTQICAAAPVFFNSPVQPDIGLPVAVANGTVYVNTNLGAVAAIEAVSGGIKWIRIYDRVQSAVNRFNQGNMRMVTDFTGPNPPIVQDNLLIVTPQDSDQIYAYDIDSGKRMYPIQRVVKSDDGDDQIKHVLGIANGYLVVSGANIHFYEIKSGKIAGHFVPETPVKGRGMVAGDVVLVATEKSLLCIDAKLANGKTRIKEEYKWEDPSKEEGGNLFVAGDVLYTVTRKYVNAYFVWQEMERKLKDRIAKTPEDLAAYGDLADVYHRIEKFDLALNLLEEGLQAAAKAKTDEKSAQALVSLRTRKFDAFFELGEHMQKPKAGQADLPGAYTRYKQALEVGLIPGMPPEKAVAALRAMAVNALARDEAATAVDHFQRLMAEYGDVVYAFVPPSSSKARLFAQARIDEIRKKNPGSYEKIETLAREALAKAGSDLPKLQDIPALYPNAEASAAALLTLAQLNLTTNPALSRQFAQRYLSRLDAAPETATASALLAVAYERSKMLGQAREILQRLANSPAFAEKTIAIDPLDPGAKTPPVKVASWASRRLAEAQFQGSPSSATCSLGNGVLSKAWTRVENDAMLPLPIVGVAPDPLRHNVFFVANQSELAVLSASDGGKEIWLPRARLPQNSSRGIWADHLLIVYGTREVAAFDSLEKGKAVWRKNLWAGANEKANLSVQASHGRLVIASSNSITVLDAASGSDLWTTQIEGPQILGQPACGDGFIAVAGQAPSKIVVYDLDTGARRAVLELPEGNLTPVPPVVVGDRIYVAQNSADHKSQIYLFDGRTGKQVWVYETESAIGMMRGTGDYLFATIANGIQTLALKTHPKPEGGNQAVLMGKVEDGPVRDLYVDGDDLYIAVNVFNSKPQIRAYSIKRGCAFRWNVDIASEPTPSLTLGELSTATGHLIVSEGNLDQAGTRPWSVVLVDRKSGKRTWDDHLESEPRAIFDAARPPSFAVQLFDGGIVITESKFSKEPVPAVVGSKIRAYLMQDLNAGEEDEKALQEKLAKNPNDADLHVKAAKRDYAAGNMEKPLFNLSALLNNAKLNDAQFAVAYTGLADVRNDIARKTKQILPFTKMAKAPKLDGNLEDWAGVAEKSFETWRDVYLAAEETERQPPKQSQWKGPSDLKVSFRGGYDEKNLYMLLVVNDEKHNNPQTEGGLCDLGDSVTLVFDIDRNGGRGFRGECFKLGACLNNAGATLAWRWVEHSLYPAKDTPLESGVFVARKEKEKQTVYQFAIPLDYLTLKPEAGRKFGFSFAVHDQDEGPVVEKSIGPSPGVLGQAYPERFGEAVLQPKP